MEFLFVHQVKLGSQPFVPGYRNLLLSLWLIDLASGELATVGEKYGSGSKDGDVRAQTHGNDGATDLHLNAQASQHWFGDEVNVRACC
jgi:hypothetical protein